MSLQWRDRIDGQDDVLAGDVNTLAHAIEDVGRETEQTIYEEETRRKQLENYGNSNIIPDNFFTFEIAFGGAWVTGIRQGAVTPSDDWVIPYEYTENGSTYPVVAIADNAFRGIDIRSIILPNSIDIIGTSAFRNCVNLHEVKQLKPYVAILEYAFAGCVNLNEFELPENVNDFGNDITAHLFEGCVNLSRVYIPKSIEYIRSNAFNGCTNLTTVYYEGSEDEWNAIDIATGNSVLENATIYFNFNKNINLENGSGTNSLKQKGSDSYASGDYSFAEGNATISGLKGYYMKSIDVNNKKIYLTDTQIVTTLSPDDNTDAEFETPTYSANDEVSIILNTPYLFTGVKISSISHNVITYTGELPFDSIPSTALSHEWAYSLFVANNPNVGIAKLGSAQHSEGYGTKAEGAFSHAEGKDTTALGNHSHTEGRNTKAGYSAHAEGYGSVAKGRYSHAEGMETEAIGDHTHAEGRVSKAIGEYSHSEGNNTTAIGDVSHSEGYKTTASAARTHAEGEETTASGLRAHSEGYKTTASGEDGSHSEGSNTTASGDSSHSEGYGTIAQGENAHAEGRQTRAAGGQAHAEGYNTIASAARSHAEGEVTKATHRATHAEGYHTIASKPHQHVQGKYNVEDTTTNGYAHIVGNGEDDNNRSNAHTIDWDGNAWFAGDVFVGQNNKKLVNEDDIITTSYIDSLFS